MFMTRRRGLAPVGSGWGVRERVGDDWMAVAIGLTCYIANKEIR